MTRSTVVIRRGEPHWAGRPSSVGFLVQSFQNYRALQPGGVLVLDINCTQKLFEAVGTVAEACISH